MRCLRTVVAMVCAVLLAPAAAGAQAPPPPDSDPFYAPRATLAAAAPGTILDSRQVTLEGFAQGAYSAAYQLAYRTTDHAGRPTMAVNTVILPSAAAEGPRKLLSYQTYEDSLTLNCAPSYTMRGGSSGGSYPFSGTQHAEQGWISAALEKGWVVVVPDYEGLLSEQAIGPLEARTTLDSIRAAESFAPAKLDGIRTQVAAIGYSGGAIPSVWANAYLAGYAPELNVVGVAAGGIPANVLALFPAFDGSAFSGASIGLLVSVQRAYPELGLDSLLNEAGRKLAAEDAEDANGCGGSIVNAPYQTADQWSVFPTMAALVADPRVQAAFANLNLIGGPAPSAPAYFWNAEGDELATIGPVEQLFTAQCATGAVIDFHREPAGEHVTGMAHYIQPSLDYLTARFAGQAPTNACPPRASHAPSPPAAAPAPRRSLPAPRRLRVRRGLVAIKVTCHCRGSIRILSRGRVLGRRSFTLRRPATVRVRLSKAAVKRLRTTRSVPVLVAIRTRRKGHRAIERRFVAKLTLSAAGGG